MEADRHGQAYSPGVQPVKGHLAVPRGTPLKERLLARIVVNPATGCWEWTLRRNNVGYGVISLGSRADGSGLVHRVAWQLWKGPIPEGLTLDHLCHKPEECAGGDTCPHRRCCNPDHLEPVPMRENTLRGNSVAALNARKTHCKWGHEFTSESTLIRPDGSRQCRICHVAAEIRSRLKRGA